MVEVNSNITSISIVNSSWDFAEIIPNAVASSVFVSGTFDLICSSCNTPSKTFRVSILSASNEILSAFRNLSRWKSKFNIFTIELSAKDVGPFLVNNIKEFIKDFIVNHSFSYRVNKSAHHTNNSSYLGVPSSHW